MQNDTGESAASINRREDSRVEPDVRSALQDGATLRVYHRIKRVAIEGLPDGDRRNGRTMSFGLVARLERAGVIVASGVNCYSQAKALPVNSHSRAGTAVSDLFSEVFGETISRP